MHRVHSTHPFCHFGRKTSLSPSLRSQSLPHPILPPLHQRRAGLACFHSARRGNGGLSALGMEPTKERDRGRGSEGGLQLILLASALPASTLPLPPSPPPPPPQVPSHPKEMKGEWRGERRGGGKMLPRERNVVEPHDRRTEERHVQVSRRKMEGE